MNIGSLRDLPLRAALDSIDKIKALLDKTANWFFTFLLIFAVIGIIYGGFHYVAAGGDPEKLNRARWVVIGSIIGAAIGILSKTIITVVKNYLV